MNPLGQDDLREILEELSTKSSKWYMIGVQLSVAKNQLDNIKAQWSDPNDQLREMIDERLKKTSPLTWSDITKALRSNTIGEERLAAEIEKKHGISSNQPQTQHSEASKAAHNVQSSADPTNTPPKKVPVKRGSSDTSNMETPKEKRYQLSDLRLKQPANVAALPPVSELPIKLSANVAASSVKPPINVAIAPPVKPPANRFIGGYRFIDPPPDTLLCCKCKSIAEEPQQMRCCGKLCCESCLETLKQANQFRRKCPSCKKNSLLTLESFSDIKSKQDIHGLQVECTNTEKGCTWTGNLGDLNTHRSECPKEEIPCPYSEAGCKEKFLREELQVHLANNQQDHLDSAMRNIREIKKAMNDLRHEVARQQSHIDKLVSITEGCQTLVPPIIFQLSDLSKHVTERTPWKTPCFYTHVGGYKMHLQVRVEMSSANIIIWPAIMDCDKDDNPILQCEGCITLHLLNQREDSLHHEMSVGFSKEQQQQLGISIINRFSFDDTQQACYTQGDTIFLRVSQVIFAYNHKPWLLTPMGQ